MAGVSLLLGLPASGQAKLVLPEQRTELIRRAHVWQPVDVASMDLLNGPQGEGAHRAGEEVLCKYEEKDPKKPIGGSGRKFPCWDAAGTRLKVKYSPENNPEVFGEVAGTRLFWALGFYAERLYSVKILCDNCPVDPFVSSSTARSQRVFEPATIQFRLRGEEVSEVQDEGWNFEDLERIDEKVGGSSRAEVDALRLLAVFVNHGDNTINQQRLLCPEGDAACARPIMYVTDLGGTFGGKDYFTSFKNWSKKAKIWEDPVRCIADFRGTMESFTDPKISEAGRKFLADLMAKLSDKQIRDLFMGARFDVLGKLENPVIGNDGRVRKVTVDDWVRVFKDKRDQIIKVKCPE
ncbi:MAG: hypothetical protein A2V88_03390 [Elusimicrobia bacterium RBG_16_66_12]|nr:MAG: hypothetical protein A2V88_03390 [Elusimicrobia bacterium RBG_16_66_12]